MRDAGYCETNDYGPGRGSSPPWPEDTLLGALTRADGEKLLNNGIGRRFNKGEVLMMEGTLGGSVFAILDGVVKVIGSGDGRDVLLAFRKRGDLAGEFAAMDREPRSATIVACDMVRTAAIPLSRFQRCVRDEPRIAEAIVASITTKLRAANKYRVDFAGLNATIRMARALYYLAENYGQPGKPGTAIQLPATQPELAALCGVANSTGQRALRRLRDQGIIITGHGSTTVQSLKQLRGVAFPG